MKRLRGENGRIKFRKYLFNEVTFALAIASAAFWVFNYVSNPQRELERRVDSIQANIEQHEALGDQLTNIKDNDLHTIEEAVKTIADDVKQLGKDMAAETALVNLLVKERDKN